MIRLTATMVLIGLVAVLCYYSSESTECNERGGLYARTFYGYQCVVVK